ncbi:MAG: TIGR04283 family arsenosugar biosynthesis glycosyltransferase [Pyrinomonadaceae bacterium]
MNSISIITPTYNEEKTIIGTLDAMTRLVNPKEIIIVDGGSTDRTVELIEQYESSKLKLVKTDFANRGRQLHEGTKHASGDVFWFIHADTRPKQGAGGQILKYMKYREVVGGNFQVIFSGGTRAASFLTWLYPHLSSIGLVYGDSAFFIRAETYEEVGGFKDYPLFEDVEIYRKLLKKGRWMYLQTPVETSSRRFENHNFLWVFSKWIVKQGLYWIGFPPRILGKRYKAIR